MSGCERCGNTSGRAHSCPHGKLCTGRAPCRACASKRAARKEEAKEEARIRAAARHWLCRCGKAEAWIWVPDAEEWLCWECRVLVERPFVDQPASRAQREAPEYPTLARSACARRVLAYLRDDRTRSLSVPALAHTLVDAPSSVRRSVLALCRDGLVEASGPPRKRRYRAVGAEQRAA